MNPVTTVAEIENSAKRAVQALYGKDITDFKVRVVFAFPHEHKRDSWDVQVTFLSHGLEYTVDLIIREKDGQITNTRLIDTMVPLV